MVITAPVSCTCCRSTGSIGRCTATNNDSGSSTSNSTAAHNGACGHVTNIIVQGGKDGEVGPQGPRGDTGPPGNIMQHRDYRLRVSSL